MKKQNSFSGKPFALLNSATSTICGSSIKSSYRDQVKELSFAPKKKPDEDHHFYRKQEHIEEWLRSQRPKSKSSRSFTTQSSLSGGSKDHLHPSSTTVKEGKVDKMTPKCPPARLRWGVPLCYFDYCPQKSPRAERQDEETYSDRGAQTDLKVLKKMRSRGSDVLQFGINKAKY